jgi:hypothetical protein
MKRVLVAVVAFAALGAWGQVVSNAEWELVSQSAKTDLKYFYKNSSETTSVKNGKRVTTALFSKSNEGSQEMVVISIPHRDCVAKYGTFNVSRINDRSSGYESEFAFGRPTRSVADGVASHLCDKAWMSQIQALVQKYRDVVHYENSKEMQKLFDSFHGEILNSPMRGSKDIDDILEEAHKKVVEAVAKRAAQNEAKQ